MLNIKTLNILHALRNVPDNEIAVVEENKKVYQYLNNEWEEYKPKENGLKISLLELNQAIVNQLPAYTDEQVQEAKQVIFQYSRRDYANARYFMLLSNELKYYTIFGMKSGVLCPMLEDEVIGCLQDLGTIKSIAKNDNGAVECWITTDNNSYPLYFFDYSKGVIQCQ